MSKLHFRENDFLCVLEKNSFQKRMEGEENKEMGKVELVNFDPDQNGWYHCKRKHMKMITIT